MKLCVFVFMYIGFKQLNLGPSCGVFEQGSTHLVLMRSEEVLDEPRDNHFF